jgi:hypothetical protein
VVSPVLEHERGRNVVLDGDSFVNMVAFGVCPVTTVRSGDGGRNCG